MGKKTEWWLDGYRPSETALMVATGAAVSSVETLVCVWRCVCVCLTGLTVFTDRQQWPQHNLVPLQVSSDTNTHLNSVSVCPSFVSLCPLLFKFPSRSTHRDALHCITLLNSHSNVPGRPSKYVHARVSFFPFKKKRSHKLELPLSNAWSGTTSLSGSGWRHNTTPQNTTQF